MPVYVCSVAGSPSIGVYSLATDDVILLPQCVALKKAERLAGWLRVKLIRTTIGGSILNGALACANSNGMILPSFIREEELAMIERSFKGNIAIMETRRTAYGNLVLANDHGALVDPRMKEPDVNQISEVLDVDVLQGEIAGLPHVGSLAVATNKGVLAHPLLRDEERRMLEDTLKVPVDVGTVNCGVPYVGSGLLANSQSAVAGSLTSGPELFIIGNAFDVVQEEEALAS